MDATMKEKARKIAATLNIILTTLGRHTERIVTWVKWLTLLLVAVFAVNLTSIDFSGKYTVSTTDHNTGETTTRVFEVDQDANPIIGKSQTGNATTNHSVGVGYAIDGSMTIDYNKSFLHILGIDVKVGVGIRQQDEKIVPRFNINIGF